MSELTGGLRSRSRLAIGAGVAMLIALAIVLGTQESHAGARGFSSLGAGWNAASPHNTVSATLTVPAIDCTKVNKGHWLGEAGGVQILGSATYTTTPAQGDFAGVFLYCYGHSVHYRAAFITLNFVRYRLSFNLAKLNIHPGDTLVLTVTVTQNRSTLTISNTNTATPKTVTIHGVGFPNNAGFKVGVFPLIDPHGAPRLKGSIPASPLSYVPGPLTSTGTLFTNITVDGKPLNSVGGVFRTFWFGKHGHTKAKPTKILTHSAASKGATFTVFSAPRHGPVVGKTMNAVRSRGHIRYRKPHSHKWVNLTDSALLPIGTEMDARAGYVQMTFGLPHGGTQTGVFSKGKFGVRQSKKTGKTNIILEGGNFGKCRPKDGDGDYDGDFLSSSIRAGSTATIARKKHHKKKHHKRVRSLWANAHGNYTTTGSYGAAAVLGTHWLTRDTCAGTFFKVTRDKIRVTVFYPHRHTVVVHQGHSLLAPAPPYPLASPST